MKLIEADAKRLLENNGLAVPGGRVLLRAEELLPAAHGDIAIKAQLLAGGRGKAGLVRFAGELDAPCVMGDVGSSHIARNENSVAIVGADGRIVLRASSARADHPKISGALRPTTSQQGEKQRHSKTRDHFDCFVFFR